MKDPEPSTLDLKITDASLSIKGKSTTSDEEYELNINFFKKIDASSVKKTVTGSHIFFIIVKKDLDAEFWTRLTSAKVKFRNIRTDFDKWVDEDEQDEEDDSAMDQMAGMEGVGGMPGMGGMGGMGDMSHLLSGMGGGAGGPGGLPDLGAFSKNNLDFSELAKQFGGKGDAGLGKSGPSQFGDFSEANYSSSGNEEEDDDQDEASHDHGHSHSHAHGDEGHSHSHSH